MSGKTIGRSLNHGFAGNFARNPDLIAVTRPNSSSGDIVFGSPLMADAQGGVAPVDATFDAGLFVGVAGSEVKSSFTYLDQGEAGGKYAPKEAVTVIQRGSVSVLCSDGSPATGGDVFVRVVANGTKAVGDIEAVADGTNSIKLANAQWGGAADANKIAELVLLTRNRA